MPTVQTIISGTASTPSTSTKFYASLMGHGNDAWTLENRSQAVIPTTGKLTNFKVGVVVAPGGGKSWTFTIRRALSGGSVSDTTLSVTIADTEVLSSLDTDEVTVAAGDVVSVSCQPSGTPSAADAVHWRCDFIPDTDGETILLSGLSNGNLLNTYYNTLIGAKFPTATEFDAQTLFPTAGTLKSFYVDLSTAPGAGDSQILTIVKNGIAQSLVVTISGTAKTGNDSDPAHNVTIAAGDKVTIQNSIVGTPSASQARFGIVFLPDIPGEYIASATTYDLTISTAIEFQHLNCGSSILTTTESEQHGLAPVITAKKIYVNLSTAPGAGNSWIFTLREALADTALTVTISGTATSGNAAVDEVIAVDTLVDTSIDATAGAATSKSQIAILFSSASAQIGNPQDYGENIRELRESQLRRRGINPDAKSWHYLWGIRHPGH